MYSQLILLPLWTIFLSFGSTVGNYPKKISHDYSEYRTNKNNIYGGQINNLNHSLTPFSLCFIHITNFEGQDFLEFKQPVILTRFDTVLIDQISKEGHQSTLITITLPYENVPSKNTTLSFEEWLDIETSFSKKNFFFGGLGKPWRCEAYIYLHPPSFLNNRLWEMHYIQAVGRPHRLKLPTFLSEIRYGAPKNEKKYWESMQLGSAQTRMRYDVLITPKSNLGKLSNSWVHSMLVNQLRRVSRSVSWELFGITTNEVKQNEELNWMRPQRKQFVAEFMVHYCHHCVKCLPFSAKVLIHLTNPPNKHFYQKLNSQQLDHYINNANSDLTGIILKLNLPVSEKVGVISEKTRLLNYKYDWELEQKVLNTALGNFTYHYDRKSFPKHSFCGLQSDNREIKSKPKCGCGFISYWYPRVSDSYTSPYFYLDFPLLPTNFKFVSCGYLSQYSRLNDITTAYDTFSWIAILTVLLLLPLIFIYVEDWRIAVATCKPKSYHDFHSKYVQYLFGSYRTLLEQGEEENTNFVMRTNYSFRIILLCFIPMCVVISNAFKGNNITKIVSPSRDVPLSKLKQLVDSGYDIVSEMIVTPAISLDDEIVIEQVISPHEAIVSVTASPSKKLKANSEIYIVILAQNYDYGLFEPNESKLSTKEIYILNNTKMLQLKTYRVENGVMYGDGNFRKFVNCSEKFAVVAEEVQIDRFRRQYLRQFGRVFKSKLSFGDEILASQQVGLYISGWINPKLYRRLENLHRSGFIEYLRKSGRVLYSTYSSIEFPESISFKPPTMKEGMRIIFYLTMIGCFAGGIIFVVERVLVNVVLVAVLKNFMTNTI